jgi:alkylation response protein AidB-like acyl-CoA dehydrogenase
MQAAELAVECEIGRLLCYRVAWLQEHGLVPNHEASVAKVFMASLGIKSANVTIGALGLTGQLMPVDARSRLRGRTAMSHLLAVSGPIGGGTGEIQRNIIAQRGLGLPRA